MSNYIDFVEEKLELGYDYGAIGGMRFNTSIIKTGDKEEQRNVNWWLPLGRWQLGERTLLESDLEGVKELEYLRGFHQARKGSKQGFRFKDWSDYKVIDQFIGVGNGTKTQWQLIKIYGTGLYQTYRPITKPVEGTVKVYLDNSEVANGWSIDYSTGIITFEVALIEGIMINCDFEFDVPVWFETDEFSSTLEGYQKDSQTGDVTAIYRLGNLAVQEGKIPLLLPYDYLLPLPQKLAATLNLGTLTDILTKDKFDTSKESLVSGFVRRDSNIKQAESYLGITRNWNQEELDNLLSFFWNCKGKAVNFTLELNGEKYLVRFKEDNLNIKFLVSDRYSGESIYAIANLGFFVFSTIVPLPTMPNFTNENIFIDFGLEISENSNPLVSPYASGTQGGAAEGAVGAGATEAAAAAASAGASISGFSAGSQILPDITFDPSFTPKYLTEVAGLPIVVGTVNNGTYLGDLYIAIPHLPYDGQFNLYPLNYALRFSPDGIQFRYRVGAARLALPVVPLPSTSDERRTIVLSVFPDLSWEIVEVLTGSAAGSATNLSTASADTIFLQTRSGLTGLNPRNMQIGLANSSSFVVNYLLAASRPAYQSNNLGYTEGALLFEGYSTDKIQSVQDGVLVTEFDWNTTMAYSQVYGDIDPSGQYGGFIHNNVALCPGFTDRANPANCPANERTRHVVVIEKVAGAYVFAGAFEYSSEYNNLNPGRECYFQRNLILNHKMILNLPSGIKFNLSQFVGVDPTFVSVGQTYIAILFNNNGWGMAFANVSNSR